MSWTNFQGPKDIRAIEVDCIGNTMPYIDQDNQGPLVQN